MKGKKVILGFSLFLLSLGVVGRIEAPQVGNAATKNNEVLLEKLNKLDEEYIQEGNQVINDNEPTVYWIEETQETVIRYADGTVSKLSN